MEDLAIRIGRSQGETVSLTYLGSHYEDWADFRVDATLSPFRCSFNFDTLGHEILEFAEELHRLYETLSGTATLSTTEHSVSVKATIDGLGHIFWKIELWPGFEKPRLVAEVVEDQSMLPPLLEELDAVVVALRRDRAIHARMKAI
jgi:hypothetical protein